MDNGAEKSMQTSTINSRRKPNTNIHGRSQGRGVLISGPYDILEDSARSSVPVKFLGHMNHVRGIGVAMVVNAKFTAVHPKLTQNLGPSSLQSAVHLWRRLRILTGYSLSIFKAIFNLKGYSYFPRLFSKML